MHRVPRAHPARELRGPKLAGHLGGLDILLLVFMAATAVLGFRRHRLLTLFAFTTGILLICDAWFDVMTARRGGMFVSVLTAVFAELPLAAVLIGGTLRILRLEGPRFSRKLWHFGFLDSVVHLIGVGQARDESVDPLAARASLSVRRSGGVDGGWETA
ncbi:MAG: hypothetical protein ACLPXZ_18765 [Mycobacterium sp.]